jgi:hypothetical protein
MTDATTPTPEVARAEIDQLLADPKWTSAYLSGGAPEVTRMNDLSAIVAAGDKAAPGSFQEQAAQSNAAADSQRIDDYMKSVPLDLTPEVHKDVAEMLAGKAITPELRSRVEAKRAQLMNDQEWVGRYMRGDQQARREMFLTSAILSANVIGQPA